MSVRRGASGRAHYNYFRDYDPAVGGYVESDPIGLRAGSASTFAYAAGNPQSLVDAAGLAPGKIPQIPKYIADSFFQPWTKARCEALKRRIDNASKDIEKRYDDIERDPLGLPQWGPTSGSRNAESINGHWREINIRDSQRRKNEKLYDRHCRDDCPPSAPAPVTDTPQGDLTTAMGASLLTIVAGGLLILL